MGKRLYVGNLPYDADEAALKEAFAQDGRRVQTVHLVMDRETGRPRGFAFVEMGSEEDARNAITAMDGAEFGGRRLRVNEAEDRRPAGRGSPGAAGPGPRSFGSGPPRSAPPREPAGGGGGDGHLGGHGGGGGGGGGPGGGGYGGSAQFASGPAAPGGRRPWSEEEKKRADRAKPPRRKHDEDADYGGRRGARRFDDDDEEW